jgi:methylmalonyl-CoA/ethylmalonyl-CoA epimerase
MRPLPALIVVANLLGTDTLTAQSDSSWRDAVRRPALIAISVERLDRAMCWYREVLGFSPTPVNDLPAYHLRLAFMDRGDFRLELIELTGARARRPLLPDSTNDASLHGFGKVTLHAPSLAPLMAHFQELGVPFAVPPRESPEGRWFMIRDPEGNLWQFVETGA